MGHVMDSLGKALLTLEDVHFWDEVVDEDIVLSLKCNSTTVRIFLSYFLRSMCFISFLVLACVL